MALKFYSGVTKGLKLKVKMFRRLVPTIIEVTGKKLVGWGASLHPPPPPPILNRINTQWINFRKMPYSLKQVQKNMSNKTRKGQTKRQMSN